MNPGFCREQIRMCMTRMGGLLQHQFATMGETLSGVQYIQKE